LASLQSTKLSDQERAAYRERGYHVPLRGFSAEDAARSHRSFLDYWQPHSETLKGRPPREWGKYLIDTHLFLRWVYEMTVDPRVLDGVESVLGPNILVWGSQWFPKFAHDKSYVSWHQDAAYWGLSPLNVTTAWIALVPSTRENGCMRVIPGTHRGLLPQRETYAEANMLSRGQEIAVEVDESLAINFVLQPGEFSLHHIGIVHGSGPNTSDASRIGLAVRYVSPDVVQEGRARDMVLLARGRDDYGHFDIVDPPVHDLPFGQSAVHAESMARRMSNVMPATAGGPTGAGGETKAGGQLKEDG
jgi:non-heme Fe2+,alpha-ketoglutarate-dependent halogenase